MYTVGPIFIYHHAFAETLPRCYEDVGLSTVGLTSKLRVKNKVSRHLDRQTRLNALPCLYTGDKN